MKKTVLVTGSAKGIGAELIKCFAALGFNVVINYLNSEKEANDLARYIKNNYNVECLLIKADISNDNDVNNMFEEINSKFGKLDILINNAAYAQDNDYINKTKEEFMRVLEVNVYGTFLVSKVASKYMDDGIILNISSTDANDTYNEISMDYCASKAGVNSITKTFALALQNIKVLAVMLPWVRTEAIDAMNQEYLKEELKRIGQDRLLEVDEISSKIIDIINDKKIESGSIINLGSDN